MKHAITPYKLVVEGDEESMIIRTIIAEKSGARNLSEVCLLTTGSYNDAVEQANGEFIVKACNLHDEMLALLKTSLDKVEELVTAKAMRDGHTNPYIDWAIRNDETCAKIRSVIERAK